jgi:cytochrome c553
MKHIRSHIAVFALVASVIPSLAGDIESLSRNCTWCHGTSAQGYSFAPRLAGQRHQYTENQLLDFATHARDNPLSRQYMWGASAALDPQLAHDLALYFSMLPARAANDGQEELADLGRAIYRDGIPDANIASCAACHGPNAEGIEEIPRLGGLAYLYLKKRLKQWGEGYHANASPPMPRIAIKLPPDVIDALASYLSFVK